MPEIVTGEPAIPGFGEMEMMPGLTVNAVELLDTPFTCTTTGPVLVLGTIAWSVELFQFITGAATPLKITELDPWAVPKLLPLIVTWVPAAAWAGEMVAILGIGVNTTELLLDWPATVTITDPDVALLGTVSTMLVLVHVEGTTDTPLNAIELLPIACVFPNPVPTTVTCVPGKAAAGVTLLTEGVTVKGIVLLALLDTTTDTVPLIADDGTATTIFVAVQELATIRGEAGTPVKLMLLLSPCEAPNPLPEIVSEPPT